MGARQRLNSLFVSGALILAALVGWASHSWGVFLVAAAVLIAVFVHGGDIRLQQSSRRRRSVVRP